jgi:glycosyltransferase involved in cell wall biosynthesis
MSTIALVTEELSIGRGSGGIGTAFHELAILLRGAGHEVDVIFVPIDGQAEDEVTNYYAAHGIQVIRPDIERFVWAQAYEHRSYAIFRHLIERETPYDLVHFHDYKGLGYLSLVAKNQGLGFRDTIFVVQVHGPTRWSLEANDHPFSHEDQLKIDFMERESIARADVVLVPSAYMLGWLKAKEWHVPDATHIIQNVSTQLGRLVPRSTTERKPVPCNELIFFGRHEERKGIIQVCDALDLVGEKLAERGVTVTMLGGIGSICGEPSTVWLARRSSNWPFPLRLLPDYDRMQAHEYIVANARSVVVVASPVENSPYTVLETIVAGKPLITSSDGGAIEMLDPRVRDLLTCRIDRDGLAARIAAALEQGLPPARLAVSSQDTAQRWLDLHQALMVRPASTVKTVSAPKRRPKVVAGVTHFQRPAKLLDAVQSLAAQLYKELEIVVIDDGSTDETTLAMLDRMAPWFARLGVKLLRQPNRYLGAARNHIIAETDSDYLLFLDDDDIAFPNLVSTLVTAAETSGADIVSPISLYMPESRRPEAHPFPERFEQKVSFVPLGGPLSVAPILNAFGTATCLIRRSALRRSGGYSEVYGVGHEDYELYIRAAQAGLRVEPCPLPLFLYEVDRPSMVTMTSRARNWNRVVKSIDLTRQPTAWADMLSLVTGQRCQEHIENFGRYREKIDPQAALLARMDAEAPSTASYAEMLGDFAQNIGAASFAKAARELAARRLARMDKGAEVILMPPLQRTAPNLCEPKKPDADPLVLGALIDLSLDRVEQAVDGLLLSWDHGPTQLTGPQLRLLRAIADHRELTAADAHRLLPPLLHGRFELADLDSLVPITFRLALRSRQLPIALSALDRAHVIDEALYLANNAEVSALVANGKYASSLDHFLRASDRDPSGFQQMQTLGLALRAEMGANLPIASLRPYLVTLGGGEAPRIAASPKSGTPLSTLMPTALRSGRANDETISNRKSAPSKLHRKDTNGAQASAPLLR